MSVIDTYNRGTAIRFTADVVDQDDNPLAVTPKITITNPDNVVKVSAQNMTQIYVGSYYYIWQSVVTDAQGLYTVTISATTGGYTGLVDKKLFYLR